MKYLRLSLLFVVAALLVAVLAPSPDARAEPASWSVSGLELDGDVLYASERLVSESTVEAVLRVYDVSNAMSPSQIGSLSLPENGLSRIFVEGGFVYLLVGDEVWVVDVSEPANPEVLRRTPLPGAFVASGRYIYVAVDYSELLIYRVYDDGHLELVSSYTYPSADDPSPASPSSTEDDMHTSTPRLDWPYVYPNYEGTRVNVSDPANPFAAGEYSVPSSQLVSWAVRGDVMYTIDFLPYLTDEFSLVVADLGGAWERQFYGGPIDPGPDTNIFDFSMVWGRYLLATDPSSFAIHDFSNFSFRSGTGDVSMLYQELWGAEEEPALNVEYHYEQGVIYLSKGEDGLVVMQAPFPTPVLDNYMYFPVGLR